MPQAGSAGRPGEAGVCTVTANRLWQHQGKAGKSKKETEERGILAARSAWVCSRGGRFGNYPLALQTLPFFTHSPVSRRFHLQ